jgi:hypothetical protein
MQKYTLKENLESSDIVTHFLISQKQTRTTVKFGKNELEYSAIKLKERSIIST